jgi:hypothetical protein
VHAKSCSRIELGLLEESSRRSFGAIDQVCWAHYQVVESSVGSDPLIKDSHEPGRWGPMGTHVSQAALS